MRVFLLILITLIGINAKAQVFSNNTCQDSTLISNNPCYGTSYQPVCGCDGVTYRNECLAYAQGLLNFGDGPCEFMDFDFLPNPASTIGQLQLRVICKDVADINVWIFDTFFRQKYYQVSRQFKDIELYPDIRGFGNGLFFIVVEANGVVKVKRLLVNQLN
ncbi:MAG: Kazal-type serine protease inhibitor [Bacteroidia bacterium]